MSKYLPKFLYSLILLVVFLLHLSYINNGFVWLDHRDIEMGSALVPLHESSRLLFTRFADTGFYRPLVAMTESVDYVLYGNWAGGYHLTNIILHVIAAGLVPLAIAAFFPLSLFEMLFVVLLVGVHPFGWLPVGAISYRAEILLAIFLSLTLYLHKRARKTGSQAAEFFVVVCFFLGLLSKETALFLIPAVIILWELTRNRKQVKKFGLFMSLFFSEIAVVLLYLFLRFQAVPELWRTPIYQLSFAEAVGTRFSVVGRLLFQFISPFKPALSDAVTIMSVNIWMICGVIVALGGTILLIKRGGVLSAGSKSLLFFFILLAPALALIPVPRLGSPHYGYSALLGFAPLVILLLRLVKKKQIIVRRVVYAVVALWLLTMSYITAMNGQQFKDDIILFIPETTNDTHFLEGYFYIGNYYLLHKQFASAEDAYDRALRSSPQIIAYNEQESTLYNLVLAQTKRKEYQKVITLVQHREEVQHNPEMLLLYANALHYTKRDKEAMRVLQEAKPFLTDEQRKKTQMLIDLIKK